MEAHRLVLPVFAHVCNTGLSKCLWVAECSQGCILSLQAEAYSSSTRLHNVKVQAKNDLHLSFSKNAECDCLDASTGTNDGTLLWAVLNRKLSPLGAVESPNSNASCPA